MIAAGMGRTTQAAERNARENALRSALGAMVHPETLAKHETQVRRIIVDDTCITAASPVGEPSFVEDGLALVSLRVRIAAPILTHRLKNEGILVTELDGESDLAGQWTREESRADAGKIMEELTRRLPAGVITAAADVEAATYTLEGDKMKIELPVLVRVDSAAYRIFIDNLRQALLQMGMPPRVENLPAVREHSLTSMKKSVGLPDAAEAADGFGLLAVCDLLSPKNSRWLLARVPAPVAATFNRPSGVRVTVDLLDAAGQGVASRDFDIARSTEEAANIFAYSSFHKSACIAPVLNALEITGGKCASGGTEKSDMRANIPFILSMDELRKITKVRCVVVNQ